MVFAEAGQTASLTREFIEETHRVLECTQTHPPRKGPVCLWVVEEVIESWLRAKQVTLLPLGPLPDIQHHSAVT